MIDIYKIYPVKNSDEKIILKEYLPPLTQEYEHDLNNLYDYMDEFMLKSHKNSISDFLAEGINDSFIQFLDENKNGQCTEIYMELVNMFSEAGWLTDVTIENMGMKNGHVAIFDVR